MQPSDNNMDELFRKAGENYPLKTDSGNWDAVAGKLAGNTDLPIEKFADKNNYRKLLWLLLLLPFAAIGYNYFAKNNISKKDIAKQNAIITAPKNKQIAINNFRDKSIKSTYALPSNPLQETVPANNEKSITKTSEQKNIKDPNKKIIASAKNTNDNNNTTIDLLSQKNIENNNNEVANSNALPSTDKNITTNNQLLQSNLKNTKNASITNDTTVIAINTNSNSNISNNLNNSFNKNDEKKAVSSASKQHFFYAGLLGGIDVSTVKFQSIKGVGYNLGMLMGYTFTQHFSVDAGLQWDKKKYYTNGKYFNISKTGIPSNVKLENMNGNCNMFEIPLNFNYEFSQHKKGNFFVAAGFTSYIMKKESYNYTANYYGQDYDLYKSYGNSSRNWFSVTQLSLGYEKQLSTNYKLRLQPYIKIPLSGLGIGKLPITSGGINIVITRHIY